MPLSEPQIRAARPRERAYKMFDSGGLYLQVTPSGGKLWRMRFKVDGKEKVLALGAYPKTGLRDARQARNDAQERLDEGVDPAAERQQQKASVVEASERTFKVVALEWHELRKHKWTAKYADQILKRLEADIFPTLGARPIAEITAKEMLETLKKVEARGVLVTLRRLKQYCSGIFRYAIVNEDCQHDPAAPLAGALKAPGKVKHHKALRRDDFGEFLTRIDAYDGEPETGLAVLLALLMVPRTTELRAAEWTEFENWEEEKKRDKALWRIPEARMKLDDPHLVPLSRQACETLSKLHKLTGGEKYLFPSHSAEGFMSNNTMLYALYRMGYHSRTTTHGLRTMFSTEANEHDFEEDWIERQLAHDERDDTRAAYNAAQYLPQRRRMLQWWADYLDGLKAEYLAELKAKEEERLAKLAAAASV